MKPTDTNRTDADRVAFIENGRYDIQHERNFGVWYIYDNELKDSVLDSADFGSWREAVDALMDFSDNDQDNESSFHNVAKAMNNASPSISKTQVISLSPSPAALDEREKGADRG